MPAISTQGTARLAAIDSSAASGSVRVNPNSSSDQVLPRTERAATSSSSTSALRRSPTRSLDSRQQRERRVGQVQGGPLQAAVEALG